MRLMGSVKGKEKGKEKEKENEKEKKNKIICTITRYYNQRKFQSTDLRNGGRGKGKGEGRIMLRKQIGLKNRLIIESK